MSLFYKMTNPSDPMEYVTMFLGVGLIGLALGIGFFGSKKLTEKF